MTKVEDKVGLQCNLFGRKYCLMPHGNVTSLVSQVLANPEFKDANSERISREVYRISIPFSQLKAVLQCYGVDKGYVDDLSNVMPCPETVARSIRQNRDERIFSDTRTVPEWYQKYLNSTHWAKVRREARNALDAGQAYCCFNISHPIEEWHHASYRALGSVDEWKDIRPVCRVCHVLLKNRTPQFPQECPREVMQWIA
jgi:hypothetical protein